MIRATSATSGGGDYMLISAANLVSRPITGTPYTNMKAAADRGIANHDLTEPATTASPWLTDYTPGGTGLSMSAETLMCGLMYARHKDSDPTLAAPYKTHVESVCRWIIGTELETGLSGSPAADGYILAMVRQLAGYILAADLVGMSRTLTGSRTGQSAKVWDTWLGGLRTTVFSGVAANRNDMVKLTRDHAHNWGTWGTSVRIAIDIYLGDSTDLATIIARYKRWLGESYDGTEWIKSTSYDASWECVPAGLPVVFIPVNPGNCGLDKDGVLVEDASRSATGYNTWDNLGIDYSFEAIDGALLSAILLSRQGYDAWNWGTGITPATTGLNPALRRAMARLDRGGWATGNGRITARHVSYTVNHFYGTTFPEYVGNVASGHTMGHTDWLFP